MRQSLSKPFILALATGFITLLLIPVCAQQNLRFERLDQVDGLSQSSVNCMLHDHEGFMWFGTQDGLNQYDGRKFKVFQNQPGEGSSLSNNYILSICEDEEGFIWIGTMAGGLDRFDKKTETFRVFQHRPDSNSISENSVWVVIADGAGNIWAGTSIGLNKYDKHGNKFTVYVPIEGDSTSLATEMVVSLYKDHKGRIWVGTVEGLCLYDSSTDRFRRYHNPFEKEMTGANIIWSISEMPQGQIVIGTDNGVYLLVPETGAFQRILGTPGEQHMVAWSVNPFQKGIIWVGTDRGLFRVDEPGYKSNVYSHNPDDFYSIADNNVWCLFYDSEGFLWSGTNNGICKARTSNGLFNLMSSKPGEFPALSSSRITAVLEDRQGNLWVGTDGGGLNFLPPARDKVVVFNSGNSNLRNDNIWALAADKHGNIYIGNYQGGLHRYDPLTGKIFAYPMNTGGPDALNNKRVLALLVDKAGFVWIGTRGGGLNRLDPATGLFAVFQNDEHDSSGFPANTVLSLVQDMDERIWAGTQEGGLALYLPEKQKFKVFKNNPGDKTSLSDNNVWALEADREGRLWVGTQGGLNVAEDPGDNLQFRVFTTRDGLRNNYILAIQEDSEGNIWSSSFRGLAKLNIRIFDSDQGIRSGMDGNLLFSSPLFSLFDTDHGLQDLEFNTGCCFRGPTGMMYFGGNNGLNLFRSEDIRLSNYNPPVYFTALKVFNKEVSIMPDPEWARGSLAYLEKYKDSYGLPEKITFIDNIEFTYKESVISFEFISLDFSNPIKNLYAYKLVNFDEAWNIVGGQNTATYTNLDPGEYTLLVKGSNSDGVWNAGETALQILIRPPFWKTAWFITLAGILTVLAIFLAIRRAFIVQRRKAEKEKEFIELQLKTIKSQIDPHFAFNAINTIASYIYSENPDHAYDYFTRFARMIRNILEDNEKISRPLAEEIGFVENYLELQKMRFKDKFDYFLEIDPHIPPDTQVPKMMLQSYAENSIKHGLMHRTSGGILRISVRQEDYCLVAIIEDNGVGRQKAAELNPDSTRKGYKIMEQIIALYRILYKKEIRQVVEDLVSADGDAAGTRVILTISGEKQSR
jgi:ligand-binding sensor domain-containing protein